MMKTITSAEFMEQVELGATVLPELDADHIGLQVGRFTYVLPVAALGPRQAKRLESLYRGGFLRFGHPGDFHVAPACFASKTLRHRVVDAAKLSTVPNWRR